MPRGCINQIKEYERDWARDTEGGEANSHSFGWGNPKEINYFEDNIKKYFQNSKRLWTGLIWPRTRARVRLLLGLRWKFGFYNMGGGGISGLAEELVTSKEELFGS